MRALKSVDFPTFGRPTMPIDKLIKLIIPQYGRRLFPCFLVMLFMLILMYDKKKKASDCDYFGCCGLIA